MMENQFIRRLCVLTLAVISEKCFAPRDEWEGKPTADEVLATAHDFDAFVRTGKKN